MFYRSLVAFVIMVVFTACTTTKQFEPVTGSKSDGTVTLGYEYGSFEKPVVDWNQADAMAKEKCVAWGYRTAERFSNAKKSCMTTNGTSSNCSRTQVTVTYQCLN